MKTLRDLKPGDTVFVVPKKRCHVSGEHVIAKIGNKYGYIDTQYGNPKFNLETGNSADTGSNDHANGYGYRVFLSEDEYNKYAWEQERFEDLALLLCLPWNRHSLKQLPPHVVEAIHDILEKEVT